MFRQSHWDEPLIFELGGKGRRGYIVPGVDKEIRDVVGDIRIPEKIRRREPPRLPEVSEVEVARHYTRLSEMSYGVDNGPVPLGSCTMKYNPRIGFETAYDSRVAWVHPLQDEDTIQGLLALLYDLQSWLAEITGMDKCSLHPAAGAHGELSGMLVTRKYHELRGQLNVKREVIIPDSAHGTNPASASMAGFSVVEVPSGDDGNIDMDALRSVVSERTAGLMITNPSTLGLFEENIGEITRLIHGVDGLLYYDGANLNGLMGHARPGDMGFDIAHVNIHKTFGSPHGGGGPGAGAICVKNTVVDGERGIRLPDLLPGYIVEYDEDRGRYYIMGPGKHSIGLLRAFFGNTGPLLWGLTYILMLGPNGLREASEQAVLNTNYFASLMRNVNGYSIPYGEGRPRKHEVVLSAEGLYEDTGVSALDVAKGLLDAGFYAPTIYFPLIVREALMVEFTESETIENIERYAERLKEIARIAYSSPEEPHRWPLNTSIGRVDDVKANRPKTFAPTWRIYLAKRDLIGV